MTTYAQFAALTHSEKVILATIEARKKHKIFTLHAGAVYKKTVDYFVSGVFQETTALAAGANPTLSAGQYYFDIATKILYVRMSDSTDPKTKNVIVTYRFFFSNRPSILPYDLNTGADIEWEGRLKDIGTLNLELDYDNTGVAVESSSSIKIENTDDYMADIFDTLIWENQRVNFWSWSPSIAVTEAKKIFSGIISEKAFTEKEVTFNLKDDLYKLRSPVSYEIFAATDGDVDEDTIGKSKPIIIGKVDKLRCIGADKNLDGYTLTGTVSGSADKNLLSGLLSATGTAVTGVNTLFLTEVSAGNKIRFYVGSFEYNYEVDTVNSDTSITLTGAVSPAFSNTQARNMDVLNNAVIGYGTSFITEVSPDDYLIVDDYEYKVLSVNSNTSITLDDEIEVNFSPRSIKNRPDRPWYNKNREWVIAGHKLREYSTTVTAVIDTTTYTVAAVGELEAGDAVIINSVQYSIERVSDSNIVLNQAPTSAIIVTDTITKIPVFAVWYGPKQLYFNRDYTLTNTATDARIVLTATAEKNITQSNTLINTYVFTNGTNTVTCSDNTVDLTEIFTPRDILKPKTVTITAWNEILSVTATTITLRANYADATYTGVTEYKSPAYVADDGIICVDCLGLEYASTWIKTPSDAVKYIIADVGITDINTTAFTASKEDCPYTLSLIFESAEEMPDARTMIEEVNKTCFGSLYLNSDFEFCFNVINSDKDVTFEELTDDDVLSFSAQTRNNIFNVINLEYGPTTNLTSGEGYYKKITVNSDFVNQLSKITKEFNVTVGLYSLADATLLAYRYILFRSMIQTVVSVKSKLNLALKSINDRMYLKLERLFKRFASAYRYKIGIINKITKDDFGVDVQFNDMSNIYTRVMCIAPDTTPDFSSTSLEADVVKFGYICDNYTETPDATSESELENNRIG
jgi:hypothetical protein